MENENFVENLASRLGQNASVKNVYGEPIVTEGKTIIPVAQVAYGFGGGFGKSKKKNQFSETAKGETFGKEPGGEGAGGGGGVRAKPIGVYEVTAGQTRFIPAYNNKQLIVAAIVGFMIRGWLYKKRKS